MIVTLDSKRRVSLPVALAPTAPGDLFEATFDKEEEIVTLRRLPRRKSWIKIMEACPAPMDDLPPRSREMPKKINL